MKNLISVVLLAAVCLSLAACAGEAKLSDSQEYFVGRSAAAKSMAQYPLYNQKDPVLLEYLTNITYAIASQSNRPELFHGYNVMIVEDAQFNACAFPSGFIMITTGTIKHIKATGGGEDELAAIFAHEIAHVEKRHPEIAANRMYSKQEAAKILSGAAQLGWEVFKAVKPEEAKKTGFTDEQMKKLTEGLGELVNFFGDVVSNGYGRDEEREADLVGLDLLAATGYNPEALKRVLSKLPPPPPGAKVLLSPSHPEVPERIARIDAKLKTMNPASRGENQRKERFLNATRNLQ